LNPPDDLQMEQLARQEADWDWSLFAIWFGATTAASRLKANSGKEQPLP
jgi:hypothetical protein